MEEYEYSFKVTDVQCFINYCNENNYEKLEETTQNRIVYENRNNRSIIARITTTTKRGKTKKIFDCKNVSENRADLKISNETLPMEITEENEKSINSLLQVLDFEEVSDLYRKRIVFQKDGVKFEIDDYIKPVMHVVAIEGVRQKVDLVYNDLKRRYNNIIEN